MHSRGQSTLYNILIVAIVIGVLSVLGGAGYLGYQKWFGPEEEEPVEEEMDQSSTIFKCKDVKEASFSKKLGSFQWFSLKAGRFNEPNYDMRIIYGRITDEGWKNYTDGTTKEVIGIVPPDNIASEGPEYPAGVVSIVCSNGSSVDAYLPAFSDIKGDGFRDENDKTFKTGFYIKSDGSTYYDENLTDLARASI